MITTKCNRKCDYCITKNVNANEIFDIDRLTNIYSILSEFDTSIMITGGEPTLSNNFYIIAEIANKYFNNIFLTTQNKDIINNLKTFKVIF